MLMTPGSGLAASVACGHEGTNSTRWLRQDGRCSNQRPSISARRKASTRARRFSLRRPASMPEDSCKWAGFDKGRRMRGAGESEAKAPS